MKKNNKQLLLRFVSLLLVGIMLFSTGCATSSGMKFTLENTEKVFDKLEKKGIISFAENEVDEWRDNVSYKDSETGENKSVPAVIAFAEFLDKTPLHTGITDYYAYEFETEEIAKEYYESRTDRNTPDEESHVNGTDYFAHWYDWENYETFARRGNTVLFIDIREISNSVYDAQEERSGAILKEFGIKK